jgi:hypothetical protein
MYDMQRYPAYYTKGVNVVINRKMYDEKIWRRIDDSHK